MTAAPAEPIRELFLQFADVQLLTPSILEHPRWTVINLNND